jgi:tRNA (guanine26-N2/guanine27-N2)-dimethyltransferase
MDVQEGDITVEVPEQPESGVGDVVFYNPSQELNRDITIASLREWQDRTGDNTYLDATAASGIRGVRAAAEGWDVTCCDYDESAVERCRDNFARNAFDGQTVHRDTNAYMHETRFDVVDLDPFGTPIPFADAAFQCARSLVCVTATDTAPLCGAHFESGVRSYSAVPRNTDFHAEMGLRVLLSALARTAARYDVGVTPLLSHATRHYVRTYLATTHRATDANAAIDELGYIEHCENCLYRTTTSGLIADPFGTCPNCESPRINTAGPVWLGSTHDVEYVTDVRERLTEELGTATRSRRLIDTIANEIDTPTHYDQHRLSKQWGVSAIAMDDFLDALRDDGFEASRTHYGGTTLKTDADVEAIKQATT